MTDIKNFWDSLNPKVKYCIKSFVEKMAIMLDITLICVAFMKFIYSIVFGGRWVIASLWLLFLLVLIAITWVYAEIDINKSAEYER